MIENKCYTFVMCCNQACEAKATYYMKVDGPEGLSILIPLCEEHANIYSGLSLEFDRNSLDLLQEIAERRRYGF
jgi:hypothetical protein